MAVYTSINYQQPVNSDIVNEHTSEVIAPGVYRGMYIRSHGENSRCLDVRNVEEGDGDLGELNLENIGLAFMPQGMKVFLSAPQFYNEEDPILSKLIVEPAGERDRIDLVCLQYEYRKVVPSSNKPSYVIIKGREALPGKLPKAPDVYSAEELDPEHGRTRDKFRRIRIPMAHIHVRVGTEFVTDADISNIRRSMNTNDVLKYMDSIFYNIYGNCRFDGWLLKRDGEEYNIIVTPGTGMIDGRLHSTKMDAIVQDIKPQIVLMEEQNPSTNMSLNVQLPYPSALKFEITSNSEGTIPEGASFLVSGIWVDGEQQLEETREFRLQEEIRPGETSKIIIDKAVCISEAGINMEGIVEGGINPEDINVTVYNMPVAYIIAIAQPSNVPIFRDEYDPRYVMYLPSTEMMLGWVEVDEGEFTIYINTEINNERLHWALATVRDLDPMFRRSRYGYGYGEQNEPDPYIPGHSDHPSVEEHHVLNVWVNDDTLVRSVNGLGSGVYSVGTEVTVTLVPEDRAHFVEWEDGITDNPRTFTIGHEDIYITAIFAEDEYETLSLSLNVKSPAYSYIQESNSSFVLEGNGDYEEGQSVTVTTSTTDPDYYGFIGWRDREDMSTNLSADTSYTFVMPNNDLTLVAKWGYIFSVISNDDSAGSTEGSGIYDYGESATIRAIPENGYAFVRWEKISGGTDTNNMTNSEKTVTVSGANNVYKAVFGHSVEASINDSTKGLVTSEPAVGVVGETVTLKAEPATHCYLDHWEDKNTSYRSSILWNRSWTVTADYTAPRAIFDSYMVFTNREGNEYGIRRGEVNEFQTFTSVDPFINAGQLRRIEWDDIEGRYYDSNPQPFSFQNEVRTPLDPYCLADPSKCTIDDSGSVTGGTLNSDWSGLYSALVKPFKTYLFTLANGAKVPVYIQYTDGSDDTLYPIHTSYINDSNEAVIVFCQYLSTYGTYLYEYRTHPLPSAASNIRINYDSMGRPYCYLTADTVQYLQDECDPSSSTIYQVHTDANGKKYTVRNDGSNTPLYRYLDPETQHKENTARDEVGGPATFSFKEVLTSSTGPQKQFYLLTNGLYRGVDDSKDYVPIRPCSRDGSTSRPDSPCILMNGILYSWYHSSR